MDINMKRGKEFYDNIEIPEELSARVQEAIASVDREEAKKRASRQKKQKKLLTVVKGIGTLAAALLICMTVGVNTSQVFAEELADMPVIGALAKVLTVRSYETREGDVNLKVEVPEIQPEAPLPTGEAEITVEQVNAEIQKLVEEHIEKCKTDMEEYKEAFFATGGTEEEWADRTMDVNVSYEVKYRQGPLLSLVLSTEEDWISAYGENTYYNVNLETGRNITLKDLLGEDYIRTANESIVKQIEERIAADEDNFYFGYGEQDEGLVDGFTTIDENTSFYINEKGNPVICFAKYEIAPGYMGMQEFEIAK